MNNKLTVESLKKAKEILEKAPRHGDIFAECPVCGFINQVAPEIKCKYCEAALVANYGLSFVLIEAMKDKHARH